MSVEAGVVESIFVADEAGEPMRPLEVATLVRGLGIAEDRYALGTGAFSKKGDKIRHVSLIAIEGIVAANAELDEPFTPAETRRNILTSGINLNALVGREFTIGHVAFLGTELCHPCHRPSKLLHKSGFRSAFFYRGGLRAEVLSNGLVRTGDTVTASR